ncbi:MAG: S-layer homology domain-containing protein [Propioniciclava sp.]|uniref:S-layer homology domain-containing protein n=1 Tax=Propioniciclava sp. TaxID=2038686 RepID=UPI0039E4F5F3
MRRLACTFAVGLACVGLLAGSTLDAVAAPSTPKMDVSLQWGCVESGNNKPPVAGTMWTFKNTSDKTLTTKVAVTDNNKKPTSWVQIQVGPNATATHVTEHRDKAVIRAWNSTNPGEDWNSMIGLPDCKGGNPFTDSDYFGDQFGMEVEWMFHSGTSTGWRESDGRRTYRGKEPMNRDAMAAFLYRLAGSPSFTAPAKPSFTDVPTSSQFYKEIEWLASTGISTGWTGANGTKTFRPSSVVKRDAMAAFLYRFAVLKGMPAFNPPAGYFWFEDVPEGTEHFAPMAWMAEKGISTGWKVGADAWEFRPSESVTREAFAAFIFRYTGEATRPAS